MNRTLIKNATIINEGEKFKGSVLIEGTVIKKVIKDEPLPHADNIIDAEGKWLLPGIIDDQVHFREPGLTHKATIASESVAAVAGGVTSFMEMPNTNPQTVDIEALNTKFQIAEEVSPANYSFYFGATNDNTHLLSKLDPNLVCGVKVFMGSSTGNMLVDDTMALERIFNESPILIATHCEDEYTILDNTEKAKKKYGEKIPFRMHPVIRSAEACYLSSSKAVELAAKTGARLHVLHLSTAKEMSLFSSDHVCDKRITAEACVHHLWFHDEYYDQLESMIKWNPAIKSIEDRDKLRESLIKGKIDVVATDHAPHTLSEKLKPYLQAPSGGPMVQHSLNVMLELVKQNIFTIEMVVEKMCHNPARLFKIFGRGFIREGFFADLVLVDPENKWTVTKNNILYKCGWSSLDGQPFSTAVTRTFVNGHTVYENGVVNPANTGMALEFNRKHKYERSIC
ncbi:MAG: dihydroorotase [Salinivirgaceae bacterium]|jgi:dihydroorotase|nr:dihydroorotase [Salinivirgaceae bacterium]